MILEYTHFLDAIGVKRLNSGIGIDIQDFATNNLFFCLDLNPEQCNNSHLHSKSNQNFLHQYSTILDIYIYFIITADKTGVIGIHITFNAATTAPFQLIAYAVYPKLALIDAAGDCKVVDNI